ncbi:hypothetical protein [Hymenobacter chitinivorans]|uniref:Uncharacterized protein n=1 Tax=Hymenobacter chitinivorans DSM 11115 TaxID=1121954 RepID=A0A2M9BKY8_9BACT|nr:hypothetical protein [Hymenobacter chitinivorans]PJJ58614.1 hypothetical protein CLV45_0024 [Hymenobacter chitinivorans DSM 11115]
MQKSRAWLDKNGTKLLLSVSLLLLVSGMVGQWRGMHSVVLADGNNPGQVKIAPVGLLYGCAAVLLALLALVKREPGPGPPLA